MATAAQEALACNEGAFSVRGRGVARVVEEVDGSGESQVAAEEIEECAQGA